MEFDQSKAGLMALSEALGTLRDSLVMVSLALKDYKADRPSPMRDEVVVQVERHLARIREAARRA
jgi:hypothetical protein